MEAESERSAPVCVQGRGKYSLEHGTEPNAPCDGRVGRECQEERQRSVRQLGPYTQGTLPRWFKSEKRRKQIYLCKRSSGCSVQDESRVGQAQRPEELPGGYHVGWEGSEMGTEATRRSKVVFKEGDGGSKRLHAGCRKQEVSRSPTDVWIHPLKLAFSGTLNSAGIASRPRHACSVS